MRRRVVPMLVGALLLSGCQRSRSDSELIHVFESKRSGFERIRLMATEDERTVRMVDRNQVVLLGPGGLVRGSRALGMLPEVGLTQARIAEYRKILDRIGASGGFVQDGDSLVFRTDPGLGFDGLPYKGILFRRHPPKRMEPSLDNVQVNRNEVRYRRIAEGWYLYSGK